MNCSKPYGCVGSLGNLKLSELISERWFFITCVVSSVFLPFFLKKMFQVTWCILWTKFISFSNVVAMTLMVATAPKQNVQTFSHWNSILSNKFARRTKQKKKYIMRFVSCFSFVYNFTIFAQWSIGYIVQGRIEIRHYELTLHQSLKKYCMWNLGKSLFYHTDYRQSDEFVVCTLYLQYNSQN